MLVALIMAVGLPAIMIVHPACLSSSYQVPCQSTQHGRTATIYHARALSMPAGSTSHHACALSMLVGLRITMLVHSACVHACQCTRMVVGLPTTMPLHSA